MSDLILGNGLLLICALLIAERSYRAGGEHYTSGFVISLSSAFIAASAAATMLLNGTTNQDEHTLLRMLNNLAYYAALPLIGSALFATATEQNWLKPTWGRWLLVLLALFEITRRAEAGTGYSQLMAGLTAVAILFAAFKFASLHTRIGSFVAALTLAAATLLFSPATLYPEHQSTLLYPLALAMMLVSTGLVLPATKKVR